MHRILVEAEKHKPKRSVWPSLQCLVTNIWKHYWIRQLILLLGNFGSY